MYNFQNCRKERGLSQKYVALSLGVKAPSVSDWESGKTKPTLENLIALAKLYGVSTDVLLGVEKEAKKKPAVTDGELDEKLVNLLLDLSPDEVQRVEDFVAGLKASRTK